MFPIGSSCNSNSTRRADVLPSIAATHDTATPQKPCETHKPHRHLPSRHISYRHVTRRTGPLAPPLQPSSAPAEPRGQPAGVLPRHSMTYVPRHRRARARRCEATLALQPWGWCQSWWRAEGVHGQGHLFSEGSAIPKPNASWLKKNLVFGPKEPQVGQRQLIYFFFKGKLTFSTARLPLAGILIFN